MADPPEPAGSVPGKRRPVVVLQNDLIKRSRISTVIVAAITSNTDLAKAPGNIPLDKSDSKLDRTSVINLSQIITIDKSWLRDIVGILRKEIIHTIDDGLKLILDID